MDGPFFVGSADIVTLLVALFGVMLVLFVLIPVVLVLLARAAYRRVRRDPRWTRTTLLVQEKTSVPGPRRSLVQLRLRLSDAVASARQAVAVLETHGGVRGDMASLARRLERVATPLDAHLHLMQRETDMRLLYEMLQPARARVEEIEQIVRHIRMAAYAALSGDMEGQVAAITADVEREVAALNAGVRYAPLLDDRPARRRAAPRAKGKLPMSLTARVKAVFKSNIESHAGARRRPPRSARRELRAAGGTAARLSGAGSRKWRRRRSASSCRRRSWPRATTGSASRRMKRSRSSGTTSPASRSPAARRSKSQMAMLHEQHAALATQESQLVANQQRLAERIETFRIKKDAFKATYTASEAQARANEAIAGLGGEMVAATQTLQHAQEQIVHMRARALATEELLESGGLTDYTGSADADLDRRITEVARTAQVDKQLAAIKQDVLTGGANPTRKALSE